MRPSVEPGGLFARTEEKRITVVTQDETSGGTPGRDLPFAAPVARELQRVEQILSDLVPRDIPLLSEIHARIVSGGKRLRPALVLLSARVFRVLGQQDEMLYRAAVAVEAVHLASLLHDDLIDKAPLRRGRPTIPQEFGLGPTLLAGDYLAALAYHRLCLQSRHRSLSLLATAVGRMCEAEFHMMSSHEVDERAYYAGAAGKTGALISAACEIGAVEVGADLQPAQLLGAYGRDLGIAFQIADDMLDIFGRPEVTGKPVGQDLVTGQPNLVVILALQADTDGALREQISALREDDASAPALEDLVEQMRRLKIDRKAQKIAESYAAQARTFLADLPRGVGRDALEAATYYVLSRDR